MWAQYKARPPQQQPTVRDLGLTSPISRAYPEPIDHQRTLELKQVLESHNLFETVEELHHR